jgi:hypothetical protein
MNMGKLAVLLCTYYGVMLMYERVVKWYGRVWNLQEIQQHLLVSINIQSQKTLDVAKDLFSLLCLCSQSVVKHLMLFKRRISGLIQIKFCKSYDSMTTRNRASHASVDFVIAKSFCEF